MEKQGSHSLSIAIALGRCPRGPAEDRANAAAHQHALASIGSKPSLSIVNHKRNPHDPRAMDCAARFDNVVPRETGRALREPCRLATQCEERVVEQLNHVQRPSRSSRQRPRVPGRARESCVQAKSGLAAWHKLHPAADEM